MAWIHSHGISTLAIVFLFASPAHAQDLAQRPSVLPPVQQSARQNPGKESTKPDDGPDESMGPSSALDQNDESQKKTEESRVFGVMPNRGTVEEPQTVPPISPGEKLKIAARNAFDPFVYPAIAVIAVSSDPYEGGMRGYLKQYTASLTNSVSGSMFTAGILPSVLHQDPRYFRQGSGSALRRVVYAASRIAITRNDAGQPRFNLSEVGGHAVAAGLSNMYCPSANRTLTDTLSRWGTLLILDALSNELKEFWPDMRRKLRRH